MKFSQPPLDTELATKSGEPQGPVHALQPPDPLNPIPSEQASVNVQYGLNVIGYTLVATIVFGFLWVGSFFLLGPLVMFVAPFFFYGIAFFVILVGIATAVSSVYCIRGFRSTQWPRAILILGINLVLMAGVIYLGSLTLKQGFSSEPSAMEHQLSSSESLPTGKTARKQEIPKMSSAAWCQVYTKEPHRSASGTTQNLKETLELAGYSVFLLDEPRDLLAPSPFISVADFQKAHRLSVTDSLTQETYDVIDHEYSCGKASDYALVFGNSDVSVASISNDLNGLSGIAQGRILRFTISSEPAIELQFFSRDYRGGTPNDNEYQSLNYSFATNFTGNKTVLQYAACNPSTIAYMAVLLGNKRMTLIACKEINNGYIGYVTYESFQSPEVSLYALAAIFTGSVQFPTAYAEAQLDDAILNESHDDGILPFPDKPALSPVVYIQTVTNEFSNPNSQIATRATAFEAFMRSVGTKP